MPESIFPYVDRKISRYILIEIARGTQLDFGENLKPHNSVVGTMKVVGFKAAQI